MTLERAKQYLKVDYEDDDDLISSMIKTVELFLIGAVTNYNTIKEREDIREKIEVLELSCLQDLYDNRGFYFEKEYKPNLIIKSLLQQLDIEGVLYVNQ